MYFENGEKGDLYFMSYYGSIWLLRLLWNYWLEALELNIRKNREVLLRKKIQVEERREIIKKNTENRELEPLLRQN